MLVGNELKRSSAGQTTVEMVTDIAAVLQAEFGLTLAQKM